ncbi:hypothetical protein N7508_008355 [Penicillium antarcticum]|uniref:uncharacterized protein n=1 Tax=Penicillium antarcticum TaxID=416450 RepID=UPI002399025A|nr:uncharacterized protein N7508_008355 [Penicillium antarcticum]KAJ5298106.1 hypothetical protein N7508_008355 [Penicillium antarcticum]
MMVELVLGTNENLLLGVEHSNYLAIFQNLNVPLNASISVPQDATPLANKKATNFLQDSAAIRFKPMEGPLPFGDVSTHAEGF